MGSVPRLGSDYPKEEMSALLNDPKQPNWKGNLKKSGHVYMYN